MRLRIGPLRTLATVAFATGHAPTLFRRDRGRELRQDTFRDLFAILGALYEASARMKPEWREHWRVRRSNDLPPKYQLGDETIADAVHDMRYAMTLLRRYRWKSVVQPLFDELDEPAWTQFNAIASQVTPNLIAISERGSGLRQDEIDWISAAVEQFDEAARRRRSAARSDTPKHRQVAEGTYESLYIAIQLSDRLIERLRYEAGEEG